MSACEKCWTDAFVRMTNDPRKSQAEHYQDLLIERDSVSGNPHPQTPEPTER